MSIKNILQLEIGTAGVKPNMFKIETDDTLETVLTTGYLNKYANNFGYTFSPGDLIYITLLTSNVISSAFLQINVSNGVYSLIPVTNMLNVSGTPLANQITYFVDSDTLGSTDTNEIYHKGNIAAGTANGVAGSFKAYPIDINKGYLALTSSNNISNYIVIITNTAFNQDTTLKIPDPGNGTGSFMMSEFDICDVGSNLLSFDVDVENEDLVAGGSVILLPILDLSVSKSYKIRNLYISLTGEDFSGGGGDRNITISAKFLSSTVSYSTIPAATLQSQVNAVWGSTDLPLPVATSLDLSFTSEANLIAKYSGGTADYTAGTITISGLVERVG